MKCSTIGDGGLEPQLGQRGRPRARRRRRSSRCAHHGSARARARLSRAGVCELSLAPAASCARRSDRVLATPPGWLRCSLRRVTVFMVCSLARRAVRVSSMLQSRIKPVLSRPFTVFSLRTSHGTDLSARTAAAMEEVRPVGLQAADADALRHREPLEHGAALRVDAAELALVGLPQVPCHSSPSTQVTPVTKRLDSMVRRMAPVSGSIWWIFRSRYCPTHRLPSAQARPESPPWPGAGIDATTSPVAGSILSMRASAIW